MSERLIIVDGYNLILRTPQLKPGEGRTLAEARDKLENLLVWAMDPAVHFLIVYDGREGMSHGERRGRIETRFSRPPGNADDLIRLIVEERVDRSERVTVVTSDIEVARHARAMGADIALSDLFLASTLGTVAPGEVPEKPATLSRKELEEWAELFRRRGSSDSNPEDES